VSHSIAGNVSGTQVNQNKKAYRTRYATTMCELWAVARMGWINSILRAMAAMSEHSVISWKIGKIRSDYQKDSIVAVAFMVDQQLIKPPNHTWSRSERRDRVGTYANKEIFYKAADV
jgi:hypothetical protein